MYQQYQQFVMAAGIQQAIKEGSQQGQAEHQQCPLRRRLAGGEAHHHQGDEVLHDQYADGYGMESENFHLLTMSQSVVDDLLRQFGILTMEEDGTINHTMATLLVDANGRVAYRKEGATWSTKDFMEAATKLL